MTKLTVRYDVVALTWDSTLPQSYSEVFLKSFPLQSYSEVGMSP